MFWRISVLVFSMILVCSILGIAQDQEEQDEFALLEKSFEELLDVKITTAGKTSEKIGDIPASVVIITKSEIETYGYQTVVELINHIAGLHIVDDNVFQSLSVRGFWSEGENKNVIILINGVNIKDDYFSNYSTGTLIVPVEAIDRVEVIRGPMSVMYGGGAFYGVINIVTNESSEDGKISVSYGTNNTSRIFASMSGKEGDLQFNFNASLYDTSGPDYLIEDLTTGTPEDLGYTPGQTSKDQLEGQQKYIDVTAKYRGFTLDMIYRALDQEIFIVYPTSAGDEGYSRKLNSFIGRIKYNTDLNEELSFEGKLTYQNASSHWYGELFQGLYYYLEPDLYETYEAEATLDYHPSDNLQFVAGVYHRAMPYFLEAWEYDWGGPFSLSAMIEGMMENAAFAQATFAPNDFIKFVAGARAIQIPEFDIDLRLERATPNEMEGVFTYSNDDINFVPRLASIISLGENTKLKLMYGEAINYPGNVQLVGQTTERWADPTLAPEEIKTYEANLLTSLNENVFISASLFRNEMESLILKQTIISEDGQIVEQATNAGQMTTTGFEMSVKVKLDNLFLEVAGSYQDVEDESPGYEGVDFAMSPEFLGYLYGSYDFGNGTSVAVTGKYVSEMESYWDRDGAQRGGPKVDAYFDLGANLRMRELFDSNYYLNIRMSNLLDEEFRYPNMNFWNSWEDKGPIGYGRTVLVTVGSTF